MDNKVQKVNWMRVVELENGFQCGISDKSGIIKFTFPNSHQTVMLFRDQLETLKSYIDDLIAYGEQNKDLAKSSEERKASKLEGKAKKQLVETISKALTNPSLTDEQKQALLKLIA